MVSTLRDSLSFGKTVAGAIGEKDVTFMAGSIAYQAFVSLVPLLVLLFFLVSLLGDEGLAAEVTAMTEGALPESGQALLEDAIVGSIATTGASVIGLVTLLWGSLKIFRGLDTSFSEIYDTTAEGSFVGSVKDALVVFVALVVALVAVAATTGLFALVPDNPLIGVLNPLVLAAGLTLAFLPMYYVFPDVSVTAREILPGVVVAALGWAALQSLFQVYVAVASGSDAAGAFGAVILLLTWLYFGALVLLVAGVVNAVRGGYIEPADADAQADGDTLPATNGAELTTVRRERDRFAERVEQLARERDGLRNDLDAQRSRRYRLEDRTAELENRADSLERENAHLRRELDRRRDPAWRRTLRRWTPAITHVRVGVTERRRE